MLIKASWSPVAKPLQYVRLPAKLPQIDRIDPSATVTLLLERSGAQTALETLKPGDPVKKFQKISLPQTDDYVISPVSGSIVSISPYSGDYGHQYHAVSIKVEDTDRVEEQFAEIAQSPSLENARQYLACLPGNPPLHVLSDPAKTIRTIIINGLDDDLLLSTNQYVMAARMEEVSRGIEIVKTISGIDDIVVVTVKESLQGYGHIGASVHGVDNTYPAALPQLILLNVLNREVPAGSNWEDLGVCFFSAEAVASLGLAFATGSIPVLKLLTLILKDGSVRLIEAPIGTPLSDILGKYDVALNKEDRIVIGGPMRGSAVYSLDYPVQKDTHAVMVLDRSQAAYATQYPCINCGDCIRICPARMPVNLLVRHLEAGFYEEAADSCDLYSCIDCGLCSYVCVSKIPIFQYIRLAKHELARTKSMETSHD